MGMAWKKIRYRLEWLGLKSAAKFLPLLSFFKELMAKSVKSPSEPRSFTEMRVESKPEKGVGSLRKDGKRFRVAVSTGTCPVTGQAAHNT
jgi:hypothetical protein